MKKARKKSKQTAITETERQLKSTIDELKNVRRMAIDLKISMIDATAEIQQTSYRLLKRCSLEQTNENTLPEEFVRACAEVRRIADIKDIKAFNCFGIADGDFPFYRKWKEDSYQRYSKEIVEKE